MDNNNDNSNDNMNPVQVQKFLTGVDYPAMKEDLVDKARHEGADERVLHALEDLDDGESFQTPADVSQAIGKMM
jgi:hypothetical protein